MAQTDFEKQTQDILCCFFESEVEVDSPSTNGFDPVHIATQLRQLGDHYNETVLKALMQEVQKANPNTAPTVFTDSVDSLCSMWVAEIPEVCPEKHLLRATVALSLYMKNCCPDMTTHVWSAITNIFNNRLGSWIRQQGGWAPTVFTDSVDSLCSMWVAEIPEVCPEKHLLRATVALSLYMKNCCPDMTTHVWSAITNIFNNRLGSWIRQQGGWEQVSNLRD